MELHDAAAQLSKSIQASDYIVFFGGAGVSTESGIPDFRSADGIYAQDKTPVPPEEILHINFFKHQPQIFYDFYFKNFIHEAAGPNAAHIKLAALEREGRVKAVITQNVDGLHQRAGSKAVYELHGSMHRNYCTACKKNFSLSEILPPSGIKNYVPYCTCGNIIKPDIVLYGEQLDPETLQAAIRHIEKADMLIVGGTSLSVYPAAALIHYFTGKTLVLINRDITPYDDKAGLVIHAPIGEVLSRCA